MTVAEGRTSSETRLLLPSTSNLDQGPRDIARENDFRVRQCQRRVIQVAGCIASFVIDFFSKIPIGARLATQGVSFAVSVVKACWDSCIVGERNLKILNESWVAAGLQIVAVGIGIAAHEELPDLGTAIIVVGGIFTLLAPIASCTERYCPLCELTIELSED